MTTGTSVRAKARGQALRRLRQARGWTQGALAERSGLTQPSINRYEKGRSIPYETAVRLAAALEVHPLEVLEPEHTPAPEEKRLIESWRGLSEEKRDMLENFIEMLTNPHRHKKAG